MTVTVSLEKENAMTMEKTGPVGAFNKTNRINYRHQLRCPKHKLINGATFREKIKPTNGKSTVRSTVMENFIFSTQYERI